MKEAINPFCPEWFSSFQIKTVCQPSLSTLCPLLDGAGMLSGSEPRSEERGVLSFLKHHKEDVTAESLEAHLGWSSQAGL